MYSTAKIHKLKDDELEDISKHPIRRIVSIIGTATYFTAKYLPKLLAPLSTSKYTVNNSKEFIERLKKIKLQNGYEMISFDVVNLFTNVPLNKTIDLILRKVYTQQLIETKIKKHQLKALLLLCTLPYLL